MAMNTNGEQIKLLKFFMINLITNILKCCFTRFITKISNLNHIGFRTFLSHKILSLEMREIKIFNLIYDAPTFQTKSLNFEDSNSHSHSYSYSHSILKSRQRLIDMYIVDVMLMSCWYHRLNNAYHCFSHECLLCRNFNMSLHIHRKFVVNPMSELMLVAVVLNSSKQCGDMTNEFSASCSFTQIQSMHIVIQSFISSIHIIN
jgi:hypothetical protein